MPLVKEVDKNYFWGFFRKFLITAQIGVFWTIIFYVDFLWEIFAKWFKDL